MKLPALPVTTSANDSSSSAVSQSSQGESPKDFVELLGNHVSQTSAASRDKSAIGARTDKETLQNALMKGINALDTDNLNTLLASFSALSDALTQPGKPISENTGQSGKTKKLDNDDGVTDATAVMQAFLAMLPAASETTAAIDDNNVGSMKNAGLNPSELADTQRRDVSTLTHADVAEDEAKDALSQLLDISKSASGTQHVVKQTAETEQSLVDAAKLTAATALISNERGGQESTGTSGNTLQTSAIPVAANVPSTLPGGPFPLAQPAGTQLNAPFSSPQWQDALGQQIVMFSRNGQQSAELRLNPQELGSIQISLKIDDNQAQIHLVSANSQVRSALEAALPTLRSAMAESGINLGQSSVGGDASSWQHTQQQTANNSGGNANSPSYSQQLGNTSGNAVEALDVPASLQSMAASVNGVDIFA
ncbi:flagellar hook-length control protein FliK [Brenneria rubrifaciens]|uniref:Flagellar hook-length control protein FliK n=1 Tax=Brenneria rubrifaciens TaxID=55213 RepID=A0A4P8QMN4_9GAMM|nr:flagellar hook-length control protein FliK [Brenneria rubrifaciens]QCR08257.1 flagellar hook-length control protein FliK [Brenneria rubrifaciens]